MRVAIFCHGHPRYSPGGGEHAAYALYQAINATPGWQASFWAAAPPGLLSPAEQIRCLSDHKEFLLLPSEDYLLFASKLILTEGSPLALAVCEWQPELIHTHHFVGLGLDLFWALKRWLPSVPIVHTLHEFLALCPYNGFLLRRDGALCFGPALTACSSCMPDVLIRQLMIRQELMHQWSVLVDHFVAPSRQLASLVCGSQLLSVQQIDVIENVLPSNVLDGAPLLDGVLPAVHCFGFFGNFLPVKGLDLVLKAVLLAKDQGCNLRLTIFGGLSLSQNKDSCSRHVDSYEARVARLLELLGGNVALAGPYEQHQIPALMASVAWVVMGSRCRENSPVVIEEALACRRPLLVPGLGGMAEKVRDGLDGYHYQPGSSVALAELLMRCTADHEGWMQLRSTLRSPSLPENVVKEHLDVYEALADNVKT